MTAAERLKAIEREIESLQRQLDDSALTPSEKRSLQAKLAILRQQRVSAAIAEKRERYEKSLGSA